MQSQDGISSAVLWPRETLKKCLFSLHTKLRHFGFPLKRVKTARLAKFSHLQSGSSRSVESRCTKRSKYTAANGIDDSGSTSRRTRHVASEKSVLCVFPCGKASFIWHGWESATSPRGQSRLWRLKAKVSIRLK